MTWDQKFIGLADHVATWSKDRSRKVGCVIVGPDAREIRSVGYNGFPRGINDNVDARHERPAKYLWVEHAERNAVFNAARHGASLEGCTIYVQFFPCPDCARAIIQTGIRELVAPEPDWDESRWNVKTSMEMLSESGVKVRFCEVAA